MSETVVEVERDELGRVKKGSSLNPAGKPKGSVNKLSAEIKGAIGDALHFAGRRLKEREDMKHLAELPDGVAWLAHQAETNPTLFAVLVRAVIPTQMNVDVNVLGRDLLAVLQERRDKLAQMRDITPQKEKAIAKS